MPIPEMNDSKMRFLGYCARKKAKNRIIPIVVISKPIIPIKDIGRMVRSNTLTEAKKATIIMDAVADKRKYWT